MRVATACVAAYRSGAFQRRSPVQVSLRARYRSDITGRNPGGSGAGCVINKYIFDKVSLSGMIRSRRQRLRIPGLGAAVQSGVGYQPGCGAFQCRVRRDELLDAAGQQVKAAVPAAHLGLAVLGGLRLGGVAAQGFPERDIEKVGEGAAGVVAGQGGEHLAVVVGAQDSLDDDVEAGRQRVPGGEVDEPDVRAAWHVALAQDDPPEVVLADDRQAAFPVPLAYRCGDCGLAGCGVAPDHDQPRGAGGIAAGTREDACGRGRAGLPPSCRAVAGFRQPLEAGAWLRGGEGQQAGGQDPGVLGDGQCRGDAVRGEPADLVFRFPDRVGAGGDVDVVDVNMMLARMAVRTGTSAISRGAGTTWWGNPAGCRAAG